MAVSSRSLGSAVDKDRDFCAVVIQLMPPSVGLVSLTKPFTSRPVAGGHEVQPLLDTTGWFPH